MVAQLKEAEREIATLKSANLLAGVGTDRGQGHDMWGVGYIAHRADGVAGNDLRSLALRCATGSPTRRRWSPWSAARRTSRPW